MTPQALLVSQNSSMRYADSPWKKSATWTFRNRLDNKFYWVPFTCWFPTFAKFLRATLPTLILLSYKRDHVIRFWELVSLSVSAHLRLIFNSVPDREDKVPPLLSQHKSTRCLTIAAAYNDGPHLGRFLRRTLTFGTNHTSFHCRVYTNPKARL